MRICDWKDLTEGNFTLKHIDSDRTQPHNVLQGGGNRPRAVNGLVLYLEGSAQLLPSGPETKFGAGCLAYYPAGSCYRASVEIPGTCYDRIEFAIYDPDGAEVALSDAPEALFDPCPAAFRLKISEMVRVRRHGGLASGLQSNSLLYDLIYHLAVEKFIEQSKLSGYQRIVPAILYLEQHAAQDVSVRGLAAMCDMSVSGFRRMFHRYCGMSPLQYRNALRIRHACDLLRVGEYNVSEVAERTGFGNVYYFSRAFKKATGKTPSSVMRSP